MTAVNPQLTVYPNGGGTGVTRFKLTFANNSLRNTWLRVTVLGNTNTGLASNDVFYFGNAVGETNGSTSGSGANIRYNVNTSDTSLVRGNQLFSGALVTNVYDFNKTGGVNTADTSVVRSNQSFTGILRQIVGAAPSMPGDGLPGFAFESKKDPTSQAVVIQSNAPIVRNVMPTGNQYSNDQVLQRFEPSTELLDSIAIDSSSSKTSGSLDDFFASLGRSVS